MSARRLSWKNPLRISWIDESSGAEILKEYSAPVKGAVLLGDGSGVAIAEPDDGGGKSELVLLNADGTERFRIGVPVRDDLSVIGFDQLYYVGAELTAIVSFVGRDFAYVIDPETGRYTRSYETR
jgi:hypothetical protein